MTMQFVFPKKLLHHGLRSLFVGSLIIAHSSVQGQAQLQPFVEIEENFVDNQAVNGGESGSITRISPGLSYQYVQSRIDLNMEVALDAIYNHGIEADDRVGNRLNLSTEIDLVPERWTSAIAANITRRTVDPGGELITNSLFDSENTREFRSLSIGTDYQSNLGRALKYNAGAEIDYAEFEDSDGTRGATIELGLDNSPSVDRLSWNIGLAQQNVDGEQSDSEIRTATAGLVYQASRRFSLFMTAEKPDSGIDQFDETATNVGFIWRPSTSTRFQLGAGTRGKDETYLLNATTTHSRYSLSADYSELVTTTRSLLLASAIDSTGQSIIQPTLQLSPVLVKEGRVTFDLSGRRSTFSVSLLDRKIITEQVGADEKLVGAEIGLTRILSAASTLSLSTSRQEIETTTENEIEDSRIDYERQLSRHTDFSVGLRKTRQSSEVTANRYNQSSINLNLNIVF